MVMNYIIVVGVGNKFNSAENCCHKHIKLNAYYSLALKAFSGVCNVLSSYPLSFRLRGFQTRVPPECSKAGVFN